MKRKNAAIGRYLYFLLLYVGACFFLLLIGVIVLFMNIDKWPLYRELIVFPIIASIFLPFIIYNLAQMIYYMNVKFVDIQKTKIIDCDTEEIHRRRATFTYIAFYVKVIQNGEKKIVLTKHANDKVDGLLNRYIEVGYNPKRKEWIVLED
jgi:hypothetical protein